MLNINLKFVGHFAVIDNPPVPEYKTRESAGVDLSAAIPNPIVILPGSRVLIPTGLAIEIPTRQYVGVVCSRSGLALSTGVRVGQGVGIIDKDYRDEIGVILQNDDPSESFTVKPLMRIAQLLLLQVGVAKFHIVNELGASDRAGGFGHTGLE